MRNIKDHVELFCRQYLLAFARAPLEVIDAELSRMRRDGTFDGLTKAFCNEGATLVEQLRDAFRICDTNTRANAVKKQGRTESWPSFGIECLEDSASCDCGYHENMRAAEKSHELQARQILIERITREAVRGREFDLDPVDLLREAVEKVNGDAMVVVNRMPEPEAAV